MKMLFSVIGERMPKLLRSPDEKGATLVEMLVSIAISVLVFSVLSTALVQFVLATRWGNNQLQVTSDIQVASLWLGRDALEAASFTPGAGAFYGTLDWADGSQQFRYSYDSIEGALIREHFDTGVLQTRTTIARHILNQSDISFSITGQLLTVTITPTSGAEAETANLALALRTR